jgi:hypothetical protein
VLRSTDAAVPGEQLLAVWSNRRQAERALDSLITDRLVAVGDHQRYALPG